MLHIERGNHTLGAKAQCAGRPQWQVNEAPNDVTRKKTSHGCPPGLQPQLELLQRAHIAQEQRHPQQLFATKVDVHPATGAVDGGDDALTAAGERSWVAIRRHQAAHLLPLREPPAWLLPPFHALLEVARPAHVRERKHQGFPPEADAGTSVQWPRRLNGALVALVQCPARQARHIDEALDAVTCQESIRPGGPVVHVLIATAGRSRHSAACGQWHDFSCSCSHAEPPRKRERGRVLDEAVKPRFEVRPLSARQVPGPEAAHVRDGRGHHPEGVHAKGALQFACGGARERCCALAVAQRHPHGQVPQLVLPVAAR
mmetsp:Transcript_8922/g.27691  ORF Transcript_8922/g.27691 Transcript_8922/m.27691 type:complete len:315 (-) Transcript_8922:1883-2827(-)